MKKVYIVLQQEEVEVKSLTGYESEADAILSFERTAEEEELTEIELSEEVKRRELPGTIRIAGDDACSVSLIEQFVADRQCDEYRKFSPFGSGLGTRCVLRHGHEGAHAFGESAYSRHQARADEARQKTPSPIERLRALDAEAAKIRKELGFSKPGEELSRWDVYDRDAITVTADGFGMATVRQIEQLGWDDYLENKVHQPLTEERAIKLAEHLARRAGVLE